MHAHRRRSHAVVQAIVDILGFWLIWQSTIAVRIWINPYTLRQVDWATAAHWAPSRYLVLVLWLLVWARLRLYRIPERLRFSNLAAWSGENALIICALTVVATFFSQQFGAGTSRLFVICLGPVAFGVLLLSRLLVLAWIGLFEQRRGLAPRVALVGQMEYARHLLSSLESSVAKTICGIIVSESTTVASPASPFAGASPDTDLSTASQELRVLGTMTQIAELVNQEKIHHVIILKRSLPDAEVEQCKQILWRMQLPVSYALDLPRELREAQARLRLRRLEVSQQYGLSTVDLKHRAEAPQATFVKRAFDFAAAAALLVLLAPLLLVLVALSRASSGGPVLKRTLHVGRGGRHFHSLCFHFSEHQPLTALLRRLRVDELPQLLNVLRGRMSLVGPAPLAVETLAELDAEDAAIWAPTRALVQPGLTCLWQLQRKNRPFEDVVALDLRYIQERSFLCDLWILLRTPAGILRGIKMPEPAPARLYSFAAVQSR